MKQIVQWLCKTDIFLGSCVNLCDIHATSEGEICVVIPAFGSTPSSLWRRRRRSWRRWQCPVARCRRRRCSRHWGSPTCSPCWKNDSVLACESWEKRAWQWQMDKIGELSKQKSTKSYVNPLWLPRLPYIFVNLFGDSNSKICLIIERLPYHPISDMRCISNHQSPSF